MLLPLKKTARKLRRRIRTLTARFRQPIDVAQIDAALDALIATTPAVLMVHSSLSACGFVQGGASRIIRALEARTQLLVMPTHTYCYPPPGGGAAPLYDPMRTRSRVGRITEVFWRQPEAFRSIHPTHSLAARGAGAHEAVRDHQYCETPCGRGTPYERLIHLKAGVLMFGATMNTYTFFHTAEDVAACPYLYDREPCDCRVWDPAAGTGLTVRTRKQDMSIKRRFEQMDDVLQSEGLLWRQPLGRGELLYLPNSSEVHQFLLRELERDPYYLVAQEARQQALEKVSLP